MLGGEFGTVSAVVEVGATTLGDLGEEAFRTGVEAVFDAGIGFLAVADFVVTVFTGAGFAVALGDFAFVVVALMLSTSIGSGMTFLGLPLFFATTSADMFCIMLAAWIDFTVRTKNHPIIGFGVSFVPGSPVNALPRSCSTSRKKCETNNYQFLQ